VLQGQYKTAWKHEFFPEPVNLAMIAAKQDHSCKENIHHTVEIFLQNSLHKEKPTGIASGSTWCLAVTTASRRCWSQKPIDHLH
jgi:hypothetical protein